jgi:hypothetical protein
MFDEDPGPKPVAGPINPLSYDDMKILAEQLVSLATDDLQSVLDFVRGQEPAVLQAQEDAGLQFDLGVLKPETLFAIKRFVEGKAAPIAAAHHNLLHHHHDADDAAAQLHHHHQDSAAERDEYVPGRSVKAGKKLPRAAQRMLDVDLNTLECPECHKRFADKSNLAKHIRTHTGSKPFVCEHCNKSFRHSSTLKDHLNTHESIRPYECHFEGCRKRFSNMANLKRHERTHTDVKPFVCQFCARPFNQSSNCKQHEKKCGGSTSAIKRAVNHNDGIDVVAKKPRKE